METPKTFKELFANTSIEPTTDENGNIHYNFKATMKQEPKQETLEEALNNYIAKKHTQEECVGFIDGFQLAKEKTIEEVFEWLTTNNYLTDLKETLIENFKNK
jgi:SOS response regulatory protein OraA/RecX